MTAASNGEPRQGEDIDASSYLHIDTMSNADLYCVTPPAYALSAAEGEVSLDAEAANRALETAHEEKARTPRNSGPQQDRMDIHRPSFEGADLRSVRTGESATQIPIWIPDEQPPVYFQKLVTDAASVHVRMCSVLDKRPAVWTVKRRNIALSPLAATVLVNEGLVRSKDLDLLSRNAGMKRDPSDPFSAVALATYDTVGDILLGLVEGPVEAGRQLQPIIRQHEQKRREDVKRREGIAALVVGSPAQQGTRPTDTSTLPRRKSLPTAARVDERVCGPGETQTFDPNHDGTQGMRAAEAQLEGYDTVPQKALQSSMPHAAKQIAMGFGRGTGRMIGGALKSPMTFTHSLAKGFHNTPKLYGDTVREYENVTDMRSGLSVSAKSLGHGITDGISGIFVQPIEGAQREGLKGAAKGFGRGIGGAICKPAAGAIGLVGYSFAGVYKELQGLKPGRDSEAEVFRLQGQTEFENSTDAQRLVVVKRWCMLTMWQHA